MKLEVKKKKRAGGKSPQTRKKASTMLPIYIICGVILGSILLSGMLTKIQRGNKQWGEKCTSSKQCKDGICFPDIDGVSKCFPYCGKDKLCPIGYKCVSRINPRRKSPGVVSVCVEK